MICYTMKECVVLTEETGLAVVIAMNGALVYNIYAYQARELVAPLFSCQSPVKRSYASGGSNSCMLPKATAHLLLEWILICIGI